MTQKQPTPALEYPAKEEMERIKGRTKKDLVWVLISVAVAVAAGLAAGQLV